jgi:hypothetical protein
VILLLIQRNATIQNATVQNATTQSLNSVRPPMAAPGSSHFFLIGRLGSSMTTVDPHYPRRAMVAKIAAIHGGAQLTIALPAPAKWIAIYILLRYDTVSYRCFVLLVEIIIFSLVFVAICHMR